jgi:hypothetical protein
MLYTITIRHDNDPTLSEIAVSRDSIRAVIYLLEDSNRVFQYKLSSQGDILLPESVVILGCKKAVTRFDWNVQKQLPPFKLLKNTNKVHPQSDCP